mgnify:CR=1 FL=1
MFLRPVKGGCYISDTDVFGLVSRIDTIASTIKDLLKEVKVNSKLYTDELDAELKEAKTKLNALLRHIRDIKANNKLTMQGKVKETKFGDLREYS